LLSRCRRPQTIQATADDDRNITVSGDRHSKEEDQTLNQKAVFSEPKNDFRTTASEF
jgi:hypothetical protein